MTPFYSKNGVYIIAEIGGNHEGNFEYALELTRLAIDSGADAVKFQILSAESLVNPKYDADRFLHFKRFQLTPAQYVELAATCNELGTSFMASVWDMSALDYIDRYMPIYKIGSGDLTALNLLATIARTGKPIILSTGLSCLSEVFDAIRFIENIDPSYITGKKLALLQCTSMYPNPDEDANLNVMHTLRNKTGLPVGYSDHTEGMLAAETAIAMGAEIIELHFTDSREEKTFRDHKVSATQEEIRALIKKSKKIRLLQGDYEKKKVRSEIDSGHVTSFRRGVYPKRKMKSGETIREEDLVTLRPLEGLSASRFYDLVGKKLVRTIDKFEKFSQTDLES